MEVNKDTIPIAMFAAAIAVVLLAVFSTTSRIQLLFTGIFYLTFGIAFVIISKSKEVK